jgi:hypothetical protein
MPRLGRHQKAMQVRCATKCLLGEGNTYREEGEGKPGNVEAGESRRTTQVNLAHHLLVLRGLHASAAAAYGFHWSFQWRRERSSVEK